MSVAATCPRCLSPVKPPGLWSSSWQCERHGDVLPFHTAPVSSEAVLLNLAEAARVPVWVPRPLPVGWVVSGIAWAGDERSGGVQHRPGDPAERGARSEQDVFGHLFPVDQARCAACR